MWTTRFPNYSAIVCRACLLKGEWMREKGERELNFKAKKRRNKSVGKNCVNLSPSSQKTFCHFVPKFQSHFKAQIGSDLRLKIGKASKYQSKITFDLKNFRLLGSSVLKWCLKWNLQQSKNCLKISCFREICSGFCVWNVSYIAYLEFPAINFPLCLWFCAWSKLAMLLWLQELKVQIFSNLKWSTKFKINIVLFNTISILTKIEAPRFHF